MSEAIVKYSELNTEQWYLLRKKIAPKASDLEIQYFLAICNQKGLSPFGGNQIYYLPFYDNQEKRYNHTIIVSIDGVRNIAAQTGLYGGQGQPQWCGKDGVWRDVWTESDKPHAARIEVYRTDMQRNTVGIAYLQAYDSSKGFWLKSPAHMLAKCAEAIALRKAFPEKLSGIYTNDEINDSPKKGSKYEEPITEKTKEYIAELVENTDPETLKKDDLINNIANNQSIVKDEYTGKQLVIKIQNLNHYETVEIGEVIEDLANGGSLYGEFMSDDEHTKFLESYLKGVYNDREKARTTWAIIMARKQQYDEMLKMKQEEENMKEQLQNKLYDER